MSRPNSLTPSSGRPVLKADRIARPRSSDCEYVEPAPGGASREVEGSLIPLIRTASRMLDKFVANVRVCGTQVLTGETRRAYRRAACPAVPDPCDASPRRQHDPRGRPRPGVGIVDERRRGERPRVDRMMTDDDFVLRIR